MWRGTSSRRLYGRPIGSVDFLFTTPSLYCVPRLLNWRKLRTVLRNPPTLQNASEKHDHRFYFLLCTYSESGRSNSECSSFLKYKFILHLLHNLHYPRFSPAPVSLEPFLAVDIFMLWVGCRLFPYVEVCIGCLVFGFSQSSSNNLK